MKTLLKFVNDYHWYIAACLLIGIAAFWTYGCVSETSSIMHPDKQVSRAELENELSYYVGLARARVDDLDRQDAVKQAILDSANVIGQGGTVNPAGLVNIAATIGAIGFGLNRNQKLKQVKKDSS